MSYMNELRSFEMRDATILLQEGLLRKEGKKWIPTDYGKKRYYTRGGRLLPHDEAFARRKYPGSRHSVRQKRLRGISY